MDESYGTYVDDECFAIHDYDDDADEDTDDALAMILIMILSMILMMMLMMVGAGTCIQSRFKDQGPSPGTNEQPRRDTDVILRQTKAPINRKLHSRSSILDRSHSYL